jgi:hypothetical protein
MAAPPGNKYAIGNKGGRPRQFQSPEDLQQLIDDYFQWAEGEWKERVLTVKKVSTDGLRVIEEQVLDEWGDPVKEIKWIREPEKITITGLALFCGFISRKQFLEYEEREEFRNIIKRAKLMVEREYEGGLQGNNPTGRIFALKNMGWKDQTSHELTGADGEPLYRNKTEAELTAMLQKLKDEEAASE